MNFFTNFNDVINKTMVDANTGETYIDYRLYGAVITILIVFLGLIVLFFLRGFKMET